MTTIFKNKIMEIEIEAFSSKKLYSTDLLISPTPFLTITEDPKRMYLAVTDFHTKRIFLAKMQIKYSYNSEHMLSIVRSGILKTVQLFTMWLKANKISKIQFTTVSKKEVVTDTYKDVLKLFDKYGILIKK